jgi:hypothetical protein
MPSAAPSSLRLVRADDQVVLEVSLTNLVIDGPSGAQHLAVSGPAGALQVRIAAQQIVEYANPTQPKPVPGQPVPPPEHHATQDKPIFVGATVLHYAVPAGTTIPLSVEGVLTAMQSLPLATDAANGAIDFTAPATSLGEAVLKPGKAAAPVVDATLTRMPGPYRLITRPPNGVALIHRTRPVTVGDRTELWTSRLAVRPPGAAAFETTLPVVFDAEPGTAPTSGPLGEDKIANALRGATVTTIAQQSLIRVGPNAGTRVPARLRRWHLSTLGSWVRMDGSWPGVPVFQHDAAMGRVQRQHVAISGVLFPFGHKATLSTTTVRSFETKQTRGATLFTESTITVRQRRVEFGLDKHRQLPFDHVDIVTQDDPVGDAEAARFHNDATLGGVLILNVRGKPFFFDCEAVDRAGLRSTFSMPMLFVPDADANSAGLQPELERLLAEQDTSFTEAALGGQQLGVAPDVGAATSGLARQARAAAGADRAAGSQPSPTTVIAQSVSLLRTGGKPVLTQVIGSVPALEKFGTNPPGGAVSDLAMSYAQPYLQAGFDAAANQGGLFLQMLHGKAVQVGGQITGGLSDLGLPVTMLSREIGGIAAKVDHIDGEPHLDPAALANLTSGKLDLSFLGAADALLGLLPLAELISDADITLADGQQMTSDVVDGVVKTLLRWDVPLFGSKKDVKAGFTAVVPLKDPAKPDAQPRLLIEQRTDVDTATGAVTSTTTCTVTLVELRLYPSTSFDTASDEPLIALPFKTISFTTRNGSKPDFDVDMGKVRFGGLLAFVRVLADIIDTKGFSDPPALAITQDGVRSSFSFEVPAIACGMFLMDNMTFGTSLDLNFTSRPALLFNASFGTPKSPFQVTVAALGGGGYLQLGVSSAGLELVVGSLEFGAKIAIDLVVAKASVEAMGGVTFAYTRAGGITITGFFRVRGELDVLGLIRVSVTLTLALTYQPATRLLVGSAELVVEVSLLFFSQSVTVHFERTFAGSDAAVEPGTDAGNGFAGNRVGTAAAVVAPTFAELMATPDETGSLPWDAYCAAFAPITAPVPVRR